MVDYLSMFNVQAGLLFKFRGDTCYVTYDNILLRQDSDGIYRTPSKEFMCNLVSQWDQIVYPYPSEWAPGYPIKKADPEEPWTHKDVKSSGYESCNRSYSEICDEIVEYLKLKDDIYSTLSEVNKQIQDLSCKRDTLKSVYDHLSGVISDLVKQAADLKEQRI